MEHILKASPSYCGPPVLSSGPKKGTSSSGTILQDEIAARTQGFDKIEFCSIPS